MPTLKHITALSPAFAPLALLIYQLKSLNIILAEKKSTKNIPTLKLQNPSAAFSNIYPLTYSANVAKNKIYYVTHKIKN